MLYVIPSKGRHDRVITLRSMRAAGLVDKTVICVPPIDVSAYETCCEDDVRIISAPKEIKDISATREWILLELSKELNERYVMMLDDDMDFCKRPDVQGSTKLVTIKDKRELRTMFNTLESWLDAGFACAGLSARQMNHGKSVPYVDCNRMMNAYACDTKLLRKLVSKGKLHIGRVKLMEDFDLTLQLMELGYRNRVSYEYCWNQRGSNKDGGCSGYRNAEKQAAAAHQLAGYYPDFVKVVTKTNKEAWKGMQERQDVIVDWVGAAKAWGLQ